MPNPEPSDATSFREFEHRGWLSVASRYHDYFSRLTTQSIPSLLQAVMDDTPGADATRVVRLLDIATGPGYAAGAAAGRGAWVVGVDFSATMARMATRHYPAVQFTVGDGEQLPFAADRFDAAVTNFGLLHLARPERALAEAHRVLRSGGRVGFTVWAPPEESVGFGIILRAIEAHGNPAASLPAGPPFFRFSDPGECRRVLLEAGFQSPRIDRIPQFWRLRSPEEFFEAMESATVRTQGLLRAQTSESLEAIRLFVRDAAREYEKEGGIELPMPAVLASAVKP